MSNLVKKKIIRSIRFLFLLFPITLALYLFFSDFGKIGNLLSLVNKLSLQIAFGLCLISFGYFLRYLRWRIILNSFGFYPSAKIESKLWMASYSFTATPGKIGELIRCFFLKKIFNIPLKDSFFSITLERLFDLIAVIIFVLCFLIFNYRDLRLNLEQNFILWIVFSIFLGLIIAIKFTDYKKFRGLLVNKKFKVFGKQIRIEDFLKLSNLKNLLKLETLFKITFLSLFSWGLEGLSFFVLIQKLNFDISFLKATLIHTTSGLIGALTMLPGGLGFTEAVTVSILQFQTIPLEYGIAITSIIRLMTLWYITLLGLIYLLIIWKEVFKND